MRPILNRYQRCARRKAPARMKARVFVPRRSFPVLHPHLPKTTIVGHLGSRSTFDLCSVLDLFPCASLYQTHQLVISNFGALWQAQHCSLSFFPLSSPILNQKRSPTSAGIAEASHSGLRIWITSVHQSLISYALESDGFSLCGSGQSRRCYGSRIWRAVLYASSTRKSYVSGLRAWSYFRSIGDVVIGLVI